mgnify:FL=1
MVRGSNRQLDRRAFFKTVGLGAGTAMLAGCSGNQRTENDDGGSAGGTETSGSGDGEESTARSEDGGNGSSSEFDVTMTMGTTPQKIDPQDFAGPVDRAIVLCGNDKLINLHPQTGNPIPTLATDWERTAEQTLRLHLREGVTFANGDEFTAEDAAYTINRLVKKDVGGATRRDIPTVEGASVVGGEHAIDVSLNTIDPIIIGRIGYSGAVVQKSWVEEHDKDYLASHMNGTGPYTLEKFDPEVETIVRKKEDTWHSESDFYKVDQYPTSITFTGAPEASTRVNQLLAGETDLAINLPPQAVGRMEEADGVEAHPFPTDRNMYLAMRYDVEPFSNVQYRRAMNYAVNVPSVIQNVLNGLGKPIAQPTPDFWFGHNPDLEPYPHDPDEAERLIEEAGLTGQELTLYAPTGFFVKGGEVAQALANQIDQLSNVSCQAKVVDFGEYRKHVNGELENKYHFYLFGFGSNPPDAAIKMTRPLSCSKINTDFSTMCNEQLDSYLKEASRTTDQNQRKQILQEANKHVHDQAMQVFLYMQYNIFGSSSRMKYQPARDEGVNYYNATRP